MFVIFILGAMGILFIFYAMTVFSSLFVSIVTTTRKIFSIYLSYMVYNHVATINQTIGFGAVIFGVVFDMITSY
jgi:UDP-galactose transporter B1